MADGTNDIDGARQAFIAGDIALATRLARLAFRAAKDAGDVAAVGRARRTLGDIAEEDLRYGPAREAYALAADELGRALGEGHEETRLARASLALVLSSQDHEADARAMLARAEDGLGDLPPAPLSRLSADLRLTIAVGRSTMGDPPAALRMFEALLPRLPEDDLPLLATAHLHHGGALDLAGDAEGALAAEERCLALRRAAFGDDNLRVLAAEFVVARSLTRLKRTEAAFEAAMTAFARMKRLGLADVPRMSTSWATVGLVHVLRGDVRAGTTYFETACRIEEKTFGGMHAETGSMLLMLAEVHAALRDWGKVAGLCRRIVPAVRDVPGREHDFATACSLEASALLATGRAREVADRLSSCLATLDRRTGVRADDLVELRRTLGLSELVAGRRERGLASLERARAHAFDAGLDADLIAAIDDQIDAARHGARFDLKGSG